MSRKKSGLKTKWENRSFSMMTMFTHTGKGLEKDVRLSSKVAKIKAKNTCCKANNKATTQSEKRKGKDKSSNSK